MIVIPMAGLSNRFRIEGYSLPKFMLQLNGNSLFYHSVYSFRKYFEKEFFLFISLNVDGVQDFLQREIELLGIANFEIVFLDFPTKGQAETVYKGLKYSSVVISESLIIFNIDTFRIDLDIPARLKHFDGYLEVFNGSGDNWSYVKIDNNDSQRVIKTAEKLPISDLCCTGLYYFNRVGLFFEAFEFNREMGLFEKGELYIAPLYNYLIDKKYMISYNLIDRSDVIFCGTPLEYEQLLNGR
jgi:dTDP-glucose pyrophosphorylase